jgi:hypothetical protein
MTVDDCVLTAMPNLPQRSSISWLVMPSSLASS